MNEKVLDQSSKSGVADERFGAERRDLARGEKVLARSGANRWHNLIVSNAAIAVGSRLHGNKCEIYVSNMKVQLAKNFVCYPDLVIVNGEPKFAGHDQDVLLNPTVVLEIFSSTTNTAEKTKKLESVLEMESVRECLMVKEDDMRVEHYARQNAKQWIYRIYNERDDVLSIESIGCKMNLSELYAQVRLGQPEYASRAVN
jgi:Uma2 family endonuclease